MIGGKRGRVDLPHHMARPAKIPDLIFVAKHIHVARNHAIFFDEYGTTERNARHGADVGGTIDADRFGAGELQHQRGIFEKSDTHRLWLIHRNVGA